MTIDIPKELSDCASEHGCEVQVVPYFGFEDDVGEWHEGGEHIVFSKQREVGGKVYMQAVIVDPRMVELGDEPRWKLMFDLLEQGLHITIMRGGAQSN